LLGRGLNPRPSMETHVIVERETPVVILSEVKGLFKYKGVRMKLLSLELPVTIILLFATFYPIDCLSAPQTANTTDGVSFNFGLYEFSTPNIRISPGRPTKINYKNHYVVIFMPRVGRKASQHQLGIDYGFELATEPEPSKDDELPIVLISQDFKLQIPKNRYVDLALDLRFWWIYPSDLLLLISKDSGKLFTLYGKGGWSNRSYVIPHEEDENRVISTLTLGSQIKLDKNVSFLVEMERWFNPEWDRRESLRFAGSFCFNVATRDAGP
jgi:hypothetical protein